MTPARRGVLVQQEPRCRTPWPGWRNAAGSAGWSARPTAAARSPCSPTRASPRSAAAAPGHVEQVRRVAVRRADRGADPAAGRDQRRDPGPGGQHPGGRGGLSRRVTSGRAIRAVRAASSLHSAPMEKRILGRTGRAVSVVGLGTWQLGADWGEVGREGCAGRARGGRRRPGSRSWTPPTCTATGAASGSSASSWRATRAAEVTVATKMGRRVRAGPRVLHPRQLPRLDRPVPGQPRAWTGSTWCSCTARRRRSSPPTRSTTRSTPWSPSSASPRTG